MIASPVRLAEAVVVAGTPVISNDHKSKTVTIDDVTTVHAVIGFMIRSEGLEEVFFPNASLLPPDLEKVHKWCGQTEYSLMAHEDGGITLTTKDVPKELLYGE